MFLTKSIYKILEKNYNTKSPTEDNSLMKGGVVKIWTATYLYGFYFRKLKNWKKNWVHIKTTQIKTNFSSEQFSTCSVFLSIKKDMCLYSHIGVVQWTATFLKLILV